MVNILIRLSRTPGGCHPIVLKALVRAYLIHIKWDKVIQKGRAEFESRARIISGYDLAVEGCYSEHELYLRGVHRHFFNGRVYQYSAFIGHQAALDITWKNPYNCYLKAQAYWAVLKGRIVQDYTITPSWKHTLNGLLWGSLIGGLL